MGSQLTKEYDVGSVVASGGPGCVWRVHSAIKKGTNERVSVFLFEKKHYERYPKAVLDLILEKMKKEATQLSRLRHPVVLRVIQTLDDGKGEIAIVTEPVTCSLSNALVKNFNHISPVSDELRNYQFDDAEIRMGVLQLSNLLSFFHNDAKLVHGNFAPESIFITESGVWKVAGFAFSQPFDPMSMLKSPQEYQVVDSAPTSCFSRPNPSFMAPELLCSQTYDSRIDIYSLGCLIYSAYNNGASFIPAYTSISQFQQIIASLSSADMKLVPLPMQGLLRDLLSIDPRIRPTPKDIEQHPSLNDFVIKVLVFLDEFAAKQDKDKAQFLKGLLQNLNQLPKKTLERRILVQLLNELSNAPLVPLLLSNIMEIAKKQSKEDFSKITFPRLVPLMKSADSPQTQVILLQNMPLFAEHATKEQSQNYLLPMLLNAISDTKEIVQEEALKHFHDVLKFFDKETVKKYIVPKLMSLFGTQTSLSIKVLLLVTWSKIIPLLDAATIEQTILPACENWAKALVPDTKNPGAPDKPNPYTISPALLMGILSVYESIYPIVEYPTIALRLIPMVSKLSIHPALALPQFETFATCLKAMQQKVEDVRRKELANRRDFDASRQTPTDAASPDAGDSFKTLISGPSLLSSATSHTPSRTQSVSSRDDVASIFAAQQTPKQTSADPFSSLKSAPQPTSFSTNPSPSIDPITLPPTQSTDPFASTPLFASQPRPQSASVSAPSAPSSALGSGYTSYVDQIISARREPPPPPSSASASASAPLSSSNVFSSLASSFSSAPLSAVNQRASFSVLSAQPLQPMQPTQPYETTRELEDFLGPPIGSASANTWSLPSTQTPASGASLDSLFGSSQKAAPAQYASVSPLSSFAGGNAPMQSWSYGSMQPMQSAAPLNPTVPSGNLLDDFFGSTGKPTSNQTTTGNLLDL